jgi:hypothetical protein
MIKVPSPDISLVQLNATLEATLGVLERIANRLENPRSEEEKKYGPKSLEVTLEHVNANLERIAASLEKPKSNEWIAGYKAGQGVCAVCSAREWNKD